MEFSCGWTDSASIKNEIPGKIIGIQSQWIKEITPELATKVISKIKDQ